MGQIRKRGRGGWGARGAEGLGRGGARERLGRARARAIEQDSANASRPTVPAYNTRLAYYILYYESGDDRNVSCVDRVLQGESCRTIAAGQQASSRPLYQNAVPKQA